MTQHDDRHLDGLLEATETVHEHELAATRAAGEVIRDARTERSRRDLLRLLGAGGAAAIGGAAAFPLLAGAKPSGADVKTVQFAIRFELFAVAAYKMAGQAARKLGLTKGQVAAATLFAGHHTQHAEAEIAFLKGMGAEAPSTALQGDAELKPIGLSNAALKQAFSSGTGALTAALYLEELAAKTYSDFAVKTRDRTVADFAWSIAPVEESHGQYLRAALGRTPQTATFSAAIKPIATSEILAAARPAAAAASVTTAMPTVTG